MNIKMTWLKVLQANTIFIIHNLVYFEIAENMTSAISREKQLKKWNRAWKIALLEKKNPEWHDLYRDLVKQEQYPR